MANEESTGSQKPSNGDILMSLPALHTDCGTVHTGYTSCPPPSTVDKSDSK